MPPLNLDDDEAFAVPVPLREAQRLVAPIIATHEADGSDPDQLAAYLLGLRTQVHILSPGSVRQALLSRLNAPYRTNTSAAP